MPVVEKNSFAMKQPYALRTALRPPPLLHASRHWSRRAGRAREAPRTEPPMRILRGIDAPWTNRTPPRASAEAGPAARPDAGAPPTRRRATLPSPAGAVRQDPEPPRPSDTPRTATPASTRARTHHRTALRHSFRPPTVVSHVRPMELSLSCPRDDEKHRFGFGLDRSLGSFSRFPRR